MARFFLVTCDRCGAEYRGENWPQTGSGWGGHGALDLCPACTEGLLEIRRRSDAEAKAYLEPVREEVP